MDALHTLLYLTANAFHIYVFSSALRAVLGRPRMAVVERLGFTGMYVLNSGMFLLLNNPYLNLATSVLPLILLAFVYRGTVRVRLLVSVMVCVTSMLLESVIYNAGSIFLPNDPSELSVFTNIISSFALFMLAQVLRKARPDRPNAALSFGHWLAIITVPLGMMAAVAVAFRSGLGSWETILIVILLLCVNVIVFWLFDKMTDYYQARLDSQMLLEQNNAYAQQLRFIREKDREIRDLRHDMKNHVSYLMDLADKGDMDGVSGYLRRMGGELYHPQEFVSSGNDGMDSFLNYKLSRIHKLGARITIDIAIPERIDYPDFDLCVILGNLLDNAYEAFQRMPEGQLRSLDIKMRYDRDILYLRIGNTYHGPLRRAEGDREGVYRTSKENDGEHGRGLSNVIRVVESYGGTVSIHEQEQLYIVELILLSPPAQEAPHGHGSQTD